MFENIKFFATVANDPVYLFGKLIRDNDVVAISRDSTPDEIFKQLKDVLSKLTTANRVAHAYGLLAALALENSQLAVNELDTLNFSNLRWGREIAEMVKQHYQPSQRSVFASYANDNALASSSTSQRFEFKGG